MSAAVIDPVNSTAPAVASARGQTCPACHRALPIHPPLRGELAATWICEACQSPFLGVLAADHVATLSERIRLAPNHFETAATEPIPPTLRQLVEELLVRRRQRQETHERRRNPRVPCDLDAVVLGLDAHWLPCRDPINAVVIDLAAHGLGMMTAVSLHDERLAIQIACPAGLVQLLGHRAWSNMVGETFQNTGVEFMARLGRTALKADG
jgi:hypothetical protein